MEVFMLGENLALVFVNAYEYRETHGLPREVLFAFGGKTAYLIERLEAKNGGVLLVGFGEQPRAVFYLFSAFEDLCSAMPYLPDGCSVYHLEGRYYAAADESILGEFGIKKFMPAEFSAFLREHGQRVMLKNKR